MEKKSGTVGVGEGKRKQMNRVKSLKTKWSNDSERER